MVDKLAEARFFYGLLAGCTDPEKASHYFSAFVSAARSVTFTMQAVLADAPGFDAWYDAERGALAGNAVARFLLEARNETQKVGITPVHSAGVGTSVSGAGRFHCSVIYRFTALDGGTQPPTDEVVAACRAHLRHMSALVRRCYEQFKAIVDPNGEFEGRLKGLEKPPRVRVPQCPLDRAMHRQFGAPYRTMLKQMHAVVAKGGGKSRQAGKKKRTRPRMAG